MAMLNNQRAYQIYMVSENVYQTTYNHRKKMQKQLGSKISSEPASEILCLLFGTWWFTVNILWTYWWLDRFR